MVRAKSMSRAEIISQLKSRGAKGALSKMTKPKLLAMLESTAPGGDTAHSENKPRHDLELEEDDQRAGHYYRKDGKTVADGSHDHENDPWPSDAKAGASKKKTKKTKKKKKNIDPVEDPDAELTVELVNKRLNGDRHPATGRKISGKKASEMQFILLGNRMTRLMANDSVNGVDIEERLDNIDAEHAREFPKDKPPASGIDPANILEHSRKRSTPERLSAKQPDAFVAEREEDGDQDGEGMMSYHQYMKRNLKQHGGSMAKAAAAYKEQKAGHYARKDGSVRAKDDSKYSHKHTPGSNPAEKFEDAQEPAPAPAPAPPSPPSRRVTRNMDPRAARRVNRGGGSGHAEAEADANLDERIGEIKGGNWFTNAWHDTEGFVEKHKTGFIDAAETVGAIGLAVAMPGLGEAIDAEALGLEGADAGVTFTTGDIEGNIAQLDAAGESGAEVGEAEPKTWKPANARSVFNAPKGYRAAQAAYNAKTATSGAAVVAAGELVKDDLTDTNTGLTGDSGANPTPPAPTPPAPHIPPWYEQNAHDIDAFGANYDSLHHDSAPGFGNPWM